MRIASAIICLSLSFAWVPFACSSQAEGQRCNIDNGNDDCEQGLVCWSSRDLGGNADICCPSNLDNSSAPDCNLGGTSSSTASSSSTGGAGGAGGASSSSSGGGMGGDGGGGGPSSSTASAMGGGGMSQGGGGMSAGGGGAGGN